MADRIRPGDQVLATLEDGKTFLLRLAPGQQHSMHKGAIDHDDVIGRPWGDILITNTGAPVYLLRPRWIDRMMKVHRRTNIMYPKDVAYILAALDVGPGSRVVEIGTGSGAMTIALARVVSPGGTVFTYDRREEFSELARRNCAVAGFEEGIEFRTRAAGDALEPDVDAVFTDVPEPWEELGVIHDALRGSGRYAAGVPTFNQAEQLAEGLAASGFAMVETTEILVREILARQGRTRPAHRMIGHTQLVTTAVKVTRGSIDAET
jgi:tRNA (adenine57-N1/adenine58-N1)-methyltransferase